MHAARASARFDLSEGYAFEPNPCPLHATVETDVEIQCGLLLVPENRGNPDAGDIQLSVMILGSTSDDPKPDPFVYLEGGPGGSAVVGLDNWLDPVTPLLDERDVILLDQRGTGFSKPSLACDQDYDAAARFATSAEVLQKCLSRLDAAGVDRSAYNTFESAADLKDLREALNIEQWNLYGVSYGTRLALAGMAVDPEGIKTVTLDSTYPMGVDAYANLPANAQRSFSAVFAACRADATCDGQYPDLENRFYEAVRNLNLAPVEVEGTHPSNGSALTYYFDGSTFVDVLFQALYVPTIIPDVPKTIDQVTKGNVQAIWDNLIAPINPDPEEVRALQDESLDMGEETFPPYITDGMHLSVECTEEIPFTDWDAAEGSLADLPPEIAVPMGASIFGLRDSCAQWAVPAHNIDDLEGSINWSIPTLILAGSFDPITPPEWGQLVASKLTNVTYLEVAGIGHAVIGGGDCAGQLISSFADDPEGFDPNQCTIPPPTFTAPG